MVIKFISTKSTIIQSEIKEKAIVHNSDMHDEKNQCFFILVKEN